MSNQLDDELDKLKQRAMRTFHEHHENGDLAIHELAEATKALISEQVREAEQKADRTLRLAVLKAKADKAEAVREARIEALRWALNDYNMSDTDTRSNLEGYIAQLTQDNKSSQCTICGADPHTARCNNAGCDE